MSKRVIVDTVVIGGGPGGYTVAFRAADLGQTVALVEADSRLGGTCLLRGCIPSKALLHVAHVLHESKEAEAWGISFNKPKIDLDKLRSWKDSVVEKLSTGIDGLQNRRKVIAVNGWASFTSSTELKINGDANCDSIQFDKAVIAAGSVPISLPSMATDNDLILDSTGALDLKNIPSTLLVIGGGVIALELGQVYAELGSAVTVVELTDGLLLGADRDLVKPLQNHLSKTFVAIHVGTKVVAVDKKGDHCEVTIEGPDGKRKEKFDKVLCAIGRKPKTDKLHLDNTSVTLNDNGYIEVNSKQQTQDPNIFAIGDVTPGPMLAHKASAEGRVAAEVIAGEDVEFDATVIPSIVYTNPEVAWCGLTETEAKKQGIDIGVGKFPWGASGRNLAMGKSEGLTKVIFDAKTERVLGVGMVGTNAGELMGEGVLAVEMAAVAHDIAGTIHAHPSLYETLHGATEVFLGTATDLYIPKRK